MRASARTCVLLGAVVLVGGGAALLRSTLFGSEDPEQLGERPVEVPAAPVLRGAAQPEPRDSETAALAPGKGTPDASAPSSGRAAPDKKPWRLAGESREPWAGDVRIRLTERAGPARGNPRVQLGYMDGGQWITLFDGPPDEEGVVHVASVTPGRRLITATIGSLRRTLAPEVVAGRVTEVGLDLPRGALVEGQVRHAAHGTLPGVALTLTPARREEYWEDALTTRTDEGGRYRFDEVPSGRWLVAFAGGAIGPVPRTRDSLTVSGVDPVRRDFVLGRVTLRGTVRDASGGAPVPNASVAFQDFFASATTDARGAFSFIDAPSGGPYTLSVSADGYGSQFVKAEGVPETNADATTLDVLLEPAAAILLSLRDDAERPLSGDFMLSLSPLGTVKTRSVYLRADELGECAYRRVMPGSYRVGVQMEGFAQAFLNARVQLGDNNSLRYVLKRSAATDGKLAGFRGTVRNARTGEPIAGVRIEVPPAGRSCTSGSDGSYALRNMPAGAWTLIAAKDGYGFRSFDAPPLGAEEDREVDLLLDPAVTVRFQAVGRTGEPVVGDVLLSVRSEDPAGTRMTTTLRFDASGHAVCRQVVPGRCRLRLRQEAAGFAEVHTELALGENRVDARLE